MAEVLGKYLRGFTITFSWQKNTEEEKLSGNADYLYLAKSTNKENFTYQTIGFFFFGVVPQLSLTGGVTRYSEISKNEQAVSNAQFSDSKSNPLLEQPVLKKWRESFH